jgi:hypothetical protein
MAVFPFVGDLQAYPAKILYESLLKNLSFQPGKLIKHSDFRRFIQQRFQEPE